MNFRFCAYSYTIVLVLSAAVASAAGDGHAGRSKVRAADLSIRLVEHVQTLTSAERVHAESVIAESVGLRSMRLQSLPAQPLAPSLTVKVEVDGRTEELLLDQHDLRSPNYQLLVDRGNGVLESVQPGRVRTYRGWLKSDPGVDVAATIDVDGNLSATVFDGPDSLFIEPVSQSVEGVPSSWHMQYRGSDVLDEGFDCGVLGEGNDPSVLNGMAVEANASGAGGLTEIAFDADYEYYVLRESSVASVEQRILQTINLTDVVYHVTGVCFSVTTIIVRTDVNDPYLETDSSNRAVQEFREYWNANNPAAHDIAHLITGRVLEQDIVGQVPGLGGVCKDWGYAYSKLGYSSLVSRQVNLLAHEIGHNFNACHCNDTSLCTGGATDADCGIMYSVASTRITFGSRAVAAISEHRKSRECLGICSGEVPADCDQDGVADEIEIAVGTATDCNGNLIPDVCESDVDLVINVPAQYATIQQAIDAAACDWEVEVVVAPGTYVEAINFNGKAITVRSSDPLNPAVVAATIINGNGANHVVQCVSGEGPDAVLSGFTITGGNANGDDADSNGGGMYNKGSNPTVTRCVFTGNSAADGGGGMYNDNSNPTVTRCTFLGNEAAFLGGGMLNWQSSPTVTKCTFAGNIATFGLGGGMFTDAGNPTVTSCEFHENRSEMGGGMYNGVGSATIANNLFSGNIAVFDGGGMFNEGGNATVANCTFVNNRARTPYDEFDSSAGGMLNYDSSPAVTNCVFWGNFSEQILNFGSAPTVTYSNVQGGYPGTGNIDSYPGFTGDYRLSPSSPCIDAGNNTAVPADVTDLDSDGDTAEAIPLDLGGDSRFVDHTDTLDTGVPGNGHPDAVVDMGAYEFKLVLIPNYVDAVLASAPVLYWSFEEAALAPAEDRVTQLPANALVPQQGAIRGPSLAGLGMAASFNGTRDFQQTQPRFLGTSLSIGGPTVFDHYAAEMWVKLNEASGLQYVLEGSDGGTYNSPALIQGFSTNGGQPALEYFSGVRTGELGPTTLNDNQWHHIVVEVEVAAGMHTIYIDGQLSVQADGANPWRLPYLGVGATAYWDGFHGTNGLIDELAFYDLSGGSVTGEAIARHYFVLFPPELPADLDGDGDVDVDDFGIMAGCMMGPGVAYPGGCGQADLDGDGDVDMHDLARFYQAYTGP